MRWNWKLFKLSVLVLYKWFTAISRLQVTLGPRKTVQQHRWTVVRIRLCSILLKEVVLKKHFQVIVIHAYGHCLFYVLSDNVSLKWRRS